MQISPQAKEVVGKTTLLILVVFISVLFLWMIRRFLMTILMAGIFSAVAHPLYHRLTRRCRGNTSAGSVLTLLVVVFMIVLPVLFMFSIVTAQGVEVARNVTPWVQQHLSEPDALDRILRMVPFYERIEPFQDLIFRRAGEAAVFLSSFLINRLSVATLGTVNFIFHLFLLLYSMYFFLIDGHRLVELIQLYLPLEYADERMLLNRFTSVTLATLKGTALIGLLQGSLAGFAFHVAGLPSAVFWGAVMTVLSIIPAVGSSLVWIPATVFLVAVGRPFTALALLVFCGGLVGSLDNVLRPILVGKDTKMHELMILFGTLGGLIMFGVVGIVIGPIIAALFITVWDLYGVAFRDFLPEAPLVAAGAAAPRLSRPEASAGAGEDGEDAAEDGEDDADAGDR